MAVLVRAVRSFSGNVHGLRRDQWRPGVVPMIGTPSTSKARASFSGVCPPNWTVSRLFRFFFVDNSQRLQCDGLEVLVDQKSSQSVETVSGLRLTMIVS